MKYLFFGIVVSFFVACNSSSSKDLDNENDKVAGESVLNLALLYSEYERAISFPVFFNDSIVRARAIQSIVRVMSFPDSDSVKSSSSDLVSDKSITYFFDNNGLIHKMDVLNFYDSRTISTVGVIFNNHQSQTGYANVKIQDDSQVDDFSFKQYIPLKQTHNLYTYQQENSDAKLFVVPHQRHWKPLIIDTLCRPKKDDLIVWGSLKHPKKIYQVSNLVEERNVREYTYQNNVLKLASWTDDPFKIERSFTYNDKGVCVAFIDSTFSMGGFVISSEFAIELKDNLPVSITKRLVSNDEKRLIFKETFSYTFQK